MTTHCWKRVGTTVVLCTALLTTGCANAPKSMLDVFSQIPVVSAAFDSSAIQDIVGSIEDDKLSEQQLRELRDRPVPSPPGQSYELGTFRRAVAAYMLNDVELLRSLGLEFRRNSKNEVIFESIIGFVVQAEAAQGNYRAAIRSAKLLALAWLAEARARGTAAINNNHRVTMFGGGPLACEING